MRLGIAALVLAYLVSQFTRAFLAVLSPALKADLGATAGDLAQASGAWFLLFALMQVPVGALLDRVGPRRTCAAILFLGAVSGSLVFAAATAPWHVALAMGLLGVGCSPVLMASLVLFSRVYPPAAFGALAGAMIAAGSLGNLAASAPLALLVEALGWREALLGLAALSALASLLVWALLPDPPAPKGSGGGRLRDVLCIRALWPVVLVMAPAYGPAAGLRGLWAGPYAEGAFGATAATIGWVTLAMGLAMALGALAYGPADRLVGSRFRAVFWGNAVVLGALLGLAWGPSSLLLATVLLAVAGFFGSAFPLATAQARALVPAHLTGRGVTLANMAAIGGAGLMQVATRPLHAAFADPLDGFRAVFLFFALVVAVGLLLYWPARKGPA